MKLCAFLEESEIRIEVESLRFLGRLGAWPEAILQVVPDVRSRQVDGATGGSSAWLK